MDRLKATSSSGALDGDSFRERAKHFGEDAQRVFHRAQHSRSAQSHLFWSRALIAWDFPHSQHIEFTLTGGTSIHADRFSAYRLGGALPMNAEFPLMVPGYYFQELSAERFILLNTYYSVPFTRSKRWDLAINTGLAKVDFLPGLELPDSWHCGIGGGIGYTSSNGAWHWVLGYAYGVNAERDGHDGAHSVGLVMEYDLGSGGAGPLRNAVHHLNPNTWRGFDRLFGR